MDQRSEAVLAAARELFLSHGFRGTTMEAVARTAGVAKPTLYARFPDKEALLGAIGDDVMRAFREAFSEALALPGPPVARVSAAIAAKFGALDALLGDSAHAQDLMADYLRVAAPAFAEIHDGILAGVTGVLAEAGRPDAAAEARLVLAAVDGLRAEYPPGEVAALIPDVVGRLLG